jgi:demethylmenaquinone methyltransferase/2-methoxy-6-polyprenyl-1,4-benzoquinol methylase
MFAHIAGRYDLLNSLLSVGFDRRWRRFAARVARVAPGSRILDLCTGTGELAFAVSDASGGGRVVGCDFVPEMLAIARSKAARRRCAGRFQPAVADAMELPFPDGTFDAVTVAFGIRNVADVQRGVSEMARVARPGGKVVILEFARPRSRIFRALYYLYFTRVLPRVGNAVSGSPERAYCYLPASVLEFPDAEELAALMRECGLRNVQYWTLTMGIVAVHVGDK